ncbi:hypothetical protein STCU_06879 [Strigomonas culicis]|uniref:Uncharacterized protein n=1 Tax=Strigomonas culicis TaxID=28005 RepID=S9U827_9TRYP|nr:hypothetical protein STCU_06879 [Strigomonas culicis]|eukprot:EPY25028.1 hypothetical protein STCU_06879 [Strigomonas culicis]
MSNLSQPTDRPRAAIAAPAANTPSNGTHGNETIVFLRTNEVSKPDLFFVPNSHSITLKDLVEEYNISSVIECDTNGAVQPRAVAFDSPSDVLRSGHHYIARRDARVDNGGSRVTFKGKILVQEFDLPTPPQSHFASNAPSFTSDVTPMPMVGGVPAPLQQAVEAQSRGDRKRPRDGAEDDSGAERDEAVAAAPARNVPLADATNRPPPVARKDGPAGGAAGPAGTGALSAPTVASAPPLPGEGGRPTHVTQFTPFAADLHGHGEDVLVTLDSLKELCEDWEREKRENERRHADAMEVLENTRRVLFSNC